MSNVKNGASQNQSGTIKIIGIGQSLRGDDAAGLAAVTLWKEIYQKNAARPGIQVELAELPGVGLLSSLEGCRAAVLVDAVHSGAKAGKIHILDEDQLEAFGEGSRSGHGWGVAETLTLGRKLMPASLPVNLFLIGIEVGQLKLGEGISQSVAAALPEAALFIEMYITSISSAG